MYRLFNVCCHVQLRNHEFAMVELGHIVEFTE